MGTILGLDWGLKKVGIATADGEGRAVTPRGRLERKDPPGRWKLGRFDTESLKELCRRFEIAQIVVGWPAPPAGNRSLPSAERGDFENFVRRLSAVSGLPVSEIPEDLTSWEARQSRFPDEDAAAAALILEDFFAQRSRSTTAGFGVLSLVAGLALVGLGAAGLSLWQVTRKPVASAPIDVIVDVKPGTPILALGPQLRGLGLDAPQWAIKVWSATLGQRAKLQPGEFQIQGQPSLAKVLGQLTNGPQLSRRITHKEGHSLYDLQITMNEAFPGQGKDVLWKFATDPTLLKEMGAVPRDPKAKATLEGFLFPETYAYRKYDLPKVVLEEMLRQFRTRALPILSSHPTWGQTPEGRYRLLTLASMVEKESGVFDEQPIIASVFWNRLAKKMRLQSDPTTIYGLLPNFDGNIKRIHLTTPSPYNTYTLPELPAGPIANPGESALRAVLNPAFSDYLFFVSKNDGTHIFSKDYATHDKYVKEFQLRRKSK